MEISLRDKQIQEMALFKVIVKWDFFFHKKLGHCTFIYEYKRVEIVFELGAFFGSVLTIYIFFSTDQ